MTDFKMQKTEMLLEYWSIKHPIEDDYAVISIRGLIAILHPFL